MSRRSEAQHWKHIDHLLQLSLVEAHYQGLQAWTLDGVADLLSAGEPGVALEHIVGQLGEYDVVISTGGQRRLAAAGQLMNMDPSLWSGLRAEGVSVRATVRYLPHRSTTTPRPLLTDFRPNFDLTKAVGQDVRSLSGGDTTFGGARTLLIGQESILPGDRGEVLLLPVWEAAWAYVRPGMRLPMLVGSRAFGYVKTLPDIPPRPVMALR